MKNEELKSLWNLVSGREPNDEIVDITAQYVRTSEEHERVFCWLLMKSACYSFPSEPSRGEWIAKSLSDYHHGQLLPSFSEPRPGVLPLDSRAILG